MLRNTCLYTCIALAWIISFFSLRGPVAALDCDRAFDLEPNTVWRDDTSFGKKTFRWFLPSPGIATVDLLTAGSGSSWIDIRSHVCGEQAADVWVIEQSSDHLVLAVQSAGQVYLATDTKDSGFRLVTSFIQTEILEEVSAIGDQGMLAVRTSFRVASSDVKTEPEILDPDPGGLISTDSHISERFSALDASSVSKTEPEILDPDPGGLISTDSHISERFLTLDASTVLKTEPEILDPDPGGLVAENSRLVVSFLTLDRSVAPKTEPEILDPDPGGLVAKSAHGLSPRFRQVFLFEPICRRTELDDHGDTMSCASPLAFGRDVTGELANDWNDDRDVFSFRLDKISTVEILLVAEVSDLRYELSDSAGQGLAVDRAWTGDETSVHLVSNLAPGDYFFEVSGTSGAFAITTIVSD